MVKIHYNKETDNILIWDFTVKHKDKIEQLKQQGWLERNGKLECKFDIKLVDKIVSLFPLGYYTYDFTRKVKNTEDERAFEAEQTIYYSGGRFYTVFDKKR